MKKRQRFLSSVRKDFSYPFGFLLGTIVKRRGSTCFILENVTKSTPVPDCKVKGKLRRDESIYKAHMGFGYSLKEIADHLDLHYTTVSKVINAMGYKK